MQSLVNLLYGVAAGVGLAILGVPYALVWAALGAVLRFIPYLGPVLAPAPDPGQPRRPGRLGRTAGRDGMFLVLELFPTCAGNGALRRRRGVSQVALLSRWRSGPGCGDRSACSWARR